jgi:hypothetical protein
MQLLKAQEQFESSMRFMDTSTFEDTAICALLYMKELKTEIANLDLCLQMVIANGGGCNAE